MKKSINGKRKRHKNAWLFVLIFLFVFLTGIYLSVSKRDYTFIESAFKSFASSVNEFFIDKTYDVSNPLNKLANAKIKYLKSENNQLRSILNLKEEKESYIIAEVVNHSSLTWFNKVSINKGYDDNVVKDLAVVNESGLIGFVSKVSKNQSEVKLITSVSEDDMLSVLIQTSSADAYGMITSYDNKSGFFKVEDVTSKDEIKKGDSVVLSGFDNASYKGIYVGEVVSYKTDRYGLTKTVLVKPMVDFNNLLFVGVVEG